MQFGSTALHYAAADDRMKVVTYLVENCQADITTKDKDGRTPIKCAEEKGHASIADYLKAHGVIKIMMGVDMNIFPFYSGVRGIIAKYLQYR